jgi:pimeloyl-ACP methyl ester carboxylesterase
MKSPRELLISSLPVTERRLEILGISSAVLDGGEGPPVVLLHGPSGYAAHWMGVIPGLVGEHRVIAPDLPGHGASHVSEGALSAERVLAWLGELVFRTCATPPVLVGQLLGGALAARFAIAHGERLRGLVLVDSFGLTAFAPQPAFGAALGQFLSHPDEAAHENLWRYCAYDLAALQARMGERWRHFAAYNVERARSPAVQGAVGALMQELGAPAIAPQALERIQVPTTLVWGRHDLATPLSVAEAASRRYAWPLHVIENANDDPPVEQPEALVKVLQRVLASARAAQVAQ